MNSRAKEVDYGESYVYEAYPDVNALQYMDHSPPGSVRERSIRPDDSASVVARPKETEVDTQEMSQDVLPPRRNRQIKHAFLSVLGSWTWELVSCLIALGAIAGIFVSLRNYDSRPLRDWPYSITPNTLVSVLVTIGKAAVAIPLAEGVSQLKWSWYKEKDRALKDVARFDEASRGVFGAAKLIFWISPLKLASIASVTFLASFAIGPFAQQVVQIEERDVASTVIPTIPICAGRYNDIQQGPFGASYPGDVDASAPMIGALYGGLLQNFTTNETTIRVKDCISGRCDFKPFQSLGFCSRCRNITSELVAYNMSTERVVPKDKCPTTFTRESKNCLYDLRNGTLKSWSAVGTMLNITTGDELIHPDLKNIPGVVNVTAIFGEVGDGRAWPTPNSAFECTLYYCVRHYQTHVIKNEVHETPSEVKSEITFDPPTGWSPAGNEVTITPQTCLKDGQLKSPPYVPTDNCSFSLDGMNGRALALQLQGMLTGSAVDSGGRRQQFSSDIIGRIYRSTQNPGDRMEIVFKSLAERLTYHVRTDPIVCPQTIKGKVLETVAFINVRWLWLILPTVVVIATFILLVAVIIQTRKEYIWKSSPLALVFLGMQDDRQADGLTQPIFPRRPDNESMKESSAEIKMRLQSDGRWQMFGNR